MLSVFCTTRFEGFHHWPDAPDAVHFLRDLHRHEFHVKVVVRVSHEDRDVEFILLKRRVDEIIQAIQGRTEVPALMRWSCETWAKAIHDVLRHKDGLTVTRIEVAEDGENGAILEV